MQGKKVTFFVALLCYVSCVYAQDITLVKHARRPQSIKPPQSAQQYVIKEGDTLSDILTKAYGAKKQDMPALIEKFRKENPWIQDLNYIQAGAKIALPAPAKKSKETLNTKTAGEAMQVKEVSSDIYVVKQGQHLAKILRDIYGIPNDVIFHEYLRQVMEKNPDISNPDYIVPGQKLIMPSMKEVLAAVRPSGNGPVQPVLATTTGIETLPNLSPGTQPKSVAKATGVSGDGKASPLSQTVKGKVMPTLERMGGKQKNQGTYFMPMSGGTSISVNTNEIPVMELDTGKKIIFDTNGKLSPEMKGFIEKAFPSIQVISGTSANLDEIMDKVLNVSGYFSVNKNPGPLLVGEDEKLKFSGKWVVYKDFSRQSIFVINILKEEENRTPTPIRNYAGRFGIDLIELGGRDPVAPQKATGSVIVMNHSYKTLFDHIKVDYKKDVVLEVVKGSVLRVTYKAPILIGKVILTDTMPDETMLSMLTKLSYVVVNTRTEPVEGVLKTIGLKPEGPPVKIVVAQGRTELEIPALRLGKYLILKTPIDPSIAAYIASSGTGVLAW